METLTTQWFLHHELSADTERAEAWHFFVQEFLPANKSFSKDDLLTGLTGKLRVHSEQHFGPGSKLNKVILRKIMECYTADEALGDLKLITAAKIGYLYNEKVKVKGPWKSASDLEKAFR